MEWIPAYESLFNTEKRGFLLASRGVLIGLSLFARKEGMGGLVRLPRGFTDPVDGIRDLLGGSREEVAGALSELADPSDPAVEVGGTPGRLTVRVLSSDAWSLSSPPSAPRETEEPTAPSREAKRKRDARAAARAARASGERPSQPGQASADASGSDPDKRPDTRPDSTPDASGQASGHPSGRVTDVGGVRGGVSGVITVDKKEERRADEIRRARAGDAGRRTDNPDKRPDTRPDSTPDASGQASGHPSGRVTDVGGVRGGVSGVITVDKKEERRADEIRRARAGDAGRRTDNPDKRPDTVADRQADASGHPSADTAGQDDPEPAADTVEGQALLALRASPTIARYAADGMLDLRACALDAASDAAGYVMSGKIQPAEAAARILPAIADVESKLRAAAATSTPWKSEQVTGRLTSFIKANLGKSKQAWRAEQERTSPRGGGIGIVEDVPVEAWRVRTDLQPPPPPPASTAKRPARSGPMAGAFAKIVGPAPDSEES